LHLALSSSSSVSSSGNYDKVATNANWVPQPTVALIQPSSSSITMDRYAAREDGPLALSSTKSRIHAVKVCRASSSASTSCRAASSAPSYLAASSRWSPNWARLGGRPIGPDWVVVQGAGHISSCHGAQATSTVPPTSRIWQAAHPQPPPRRSHRTSTLTPTPQ
jgi:hypothetical protein